jgi:hypothetical protein
MRSTGHAGDWLLDTDSHTAQAINPTTATPPLMIQRRRVTVFRMR